MVEERRIFNSLLVFLESVIPELPDIRTGKNKKYEMRDAILSAFASFFIQCPSFLSYQRLMEQNKGNNNGRTLFDINVIPSDNQIRNLLDPIAPRYIFPVFSDAFLFLKETKILDTYRSNLDTYLIALDGTWFHSSEKIFCNSCLHKDHKDGKRTYYHTAITPVIVKPGCNKVISLEPEFIQNQDGKDKQDCENSAAKRWIIEKGIKYIDLGATFLGDDLYCKQPICELILSKGGNFLFTCKALSHKHLYEEIDSFDPKDDLNEMIIKKWYKSERLYDRYRFINNVPLKDGKDALNVNWVELTILDKNGMVRNRFAFATNHTITKDNVVYIVEAGRSRWKIENEHNNTLKTKGYNLEHNFGHGKENLSNLLLTLNLLAFLFHTILEFLDRRYALIRKTLPRRITFYNDLRALTRYMCFRHWNHLMLFMLQGLKLEDPGG